MMEQIHTGLRAQFAFQWRVYANIMVNQERSHCKVGSQKKNWALVKIVS